MRIRYMVAQHEGVCPTCEGTIYGGEKIVWDPLNPSGTRHQAGWCDRPRPVNPFSGVPHARHPRAGFYGCSIAEARERGLPLHPDDGDAR